MKRLHKENFRAKKFMGKTRNTRIHLPWKTTVFCSLLLLAFPFLQAQSSDTAGVYMTGKVQGHEVWLRWAAATPSLWEESLEKGWTLERYDFDTLSMATAAKSNLPYTPVRTVVNIPPFMQVDTSHLAALADTDMYAAVLGEAVFNPDIALSMGGIAISPWEHISKEMERKQLRFALANIAYDRSFAVACFGKTGYIDRKTEKGHYYLYRLYSNFSDTASNRFDTALYFTRMEQGAVNPPVQEIHIESHHLNVQLEWDIRFARKRSIGYYVERTVATKKNKASQYIRLNRTPLSILQERESFLMAYKDSLPNTESRFLYRVIGVDLFGDEFVVAQSRSCKSDGVPIETAAIDSVGRDEKGRTCLFWSFPEQNAAALESFSVYVTSLPEWNEDKATLLATGLQPQSRRLSLNGTLLDVSSYFYVKAIGKNKQSTLSRAYFHWSKDSLPPLPPQDLSYTVDSAGVACIHWHPSTDRDVAGYRVFRQVEKTAEPVQITASTLSDTLFYDTISLHTAQYFYYSVKSVDVSGNISKPSELLAVKNLIADKPAPAVFSNKSHPEGNDVELVWYNSRSSGTRGHKLLYKVDSSSWFLLKDFPIKENGSIPESSSFRFTFPDRMYVTDYTFNIVAYGSDSERDTANTPFEYTFTYIPEIKAPTPFAIVDRENRYVQLQWKVRHEKPFRRLLLYRRAENDKLRLLASLNQEQAKEGYYTDVSVKMNTNYGYVIQIEYEDGLWSDYSKPCDVNY